MSQIDPFEDNVATNSRMTFLNINLISYSVWLEVIEDNSIFPANIFQTFVSLRVILNAILDPFKQPSNKKTLNELNIDFYLSETSLIEDIVLEQFKGFKKTEKIELDKLLLLSKVDQLNGNEIEALTKLCLAVFLYPESVTTWDRLAEFANKLKFYRICLYAIEQNILLLLKISKNKGVLNDWFYLEEVFLSFKESSLNTLHLLTSQLVNKDL